MKLADQTGGDTAQFQASKESGVTTLPSLSQNNTAHTHTAPTLQKIVKFHNRMKAPDNGAVGTQPPKLKIEGQKPTTTTNQHSIKI